MLPKIPRLVFDGLQKSKNEKGAYCRSPEGRYRVQRMRGILVDAIHLSMVMQYVFHRIY
jgi:hypothetical protein